MINVCTIGIGNCGGQIADLAMQKYNIKGVAINSSANDLVNIKNVTKRPPLKQLPSSFLLFDALPIK